MDYFANNLPAETRCGYNIWFSEDIFNLGRRKTRIEKDGIVAYIPTVVYEDCDDEAFKCLADEAFKHFKEQQR